MGEKNDESIAMITAEIYVIDTLAKEIKNELIVRLKIDIERILSPLAISGIEETAKEEIADVLLDKANETYDMLLKVEALLAAILRIRELLSHSNND